MAQDPVCGMNVPPEQAAAQKTYMGKTYYFCSQKCESDFAANPEHYLVNYPMNRVIGSKTVLDTARFRFLLDQHCNVDSRNVQAYVIGENGDSELPVWSQVQIAGMAFSEYCPHCEINCTEEDKEFLFSHVRQAAYEIINRKGYTNYAIALELLRIMSAILRNERSVLTVSSLIDGYYGIDDVCLSIPNILDRNGISRHLNMSFDENEINLLRKSAGLLKEVRGQIQI